MHKVEDVAYQVLIAMVQNSGESFHARSAEAVVKRAFDIAEEFVNRLENE